MWSDERCDNETKVATASIGASGRLPSGAPRPPPRARRTLPLTRPARRHHPPRLYPLHACTSARGRARTTASFVSTRPATRARDSRLIVRTRASSTGVVRVSNASTHAHWLPLSPPWLIHLNRLSTSTICTWANIMELDDKRRVVITVIFKLLRGSPVMSLNLYTCKTALYNALMPSFVHL